MICLLVITDGRLDYLHDTIESARRHLTGAITRRVMYDDTGDLDHRNYLWSTYPEFEHIDAGERQGFGGAIRFAWSHLKSAREPFVFHLEQDFTFSRPVDLDEMAFTLAQQPHLAQMALRRQAWNEQEKDAGGIIEQHPGDYHQIVDQYGHQWIEHRRFFTTNPSLYRRSLTSRNWPEGDQSEGHFTHDLLRDPKLRFAFWGHRDDRPWVTHIGHQRAGVGY